MEVSALKPWLVRPAMHSNCLRLPREACFDQERWFRIGAERVEKVLVRPASDLDCTVTVCGSHVKRVLMLAFSLIFLDD